jgi:hypothetical protein
MTREELREFISRVDAGPYTKVSLRELPLESIGYPGAVHVIDFITLVPCFKATELLEDVRYGTRYVAMNAARMEYEILQSSIHFHEQDMLDMWDEHYVEDLIKNQVIQILVGELKKDFEVGPKPSPEIQFAFDESKLIP